MLTVNRLCGSGFQSIITAAQEIRCNQSHVVLTGGAENMSLAPFAVLFLSAHLSMNFSDSLYCALLVMRM